MQFLRQSTQVVVRIGPFMDATDAVTPETGITLAAADQAEALKAAGAATVDISGNTFAAVTGAGGWYDLTLSTTDTNTIGTLDIVVQDTSVCLPVFARFQVIEEAAYDTLYAASALPASTTNITAGTVTTATNVTTVNGLAANVITAASINAAALNGKGDWNIGKTGYALSAAGVQAIWDALTSALTTVGSIGKKLADWTIGTAQTGDAFARLGAPAGASVSADIAAVKAQTAAIETDTAEIGAAGAGLTALASAANLATVDTVADAIKAKTDSLTFTQAGHVDANVQKVNDVTIIGDGSGTPFQV